MKRGRRQPALPGRGALLLVLLAAGWAIPARAQPPADPPTGTLARGHIEPVPRGDLYVGVRDATLPAGAATAIGGPPGFLVSENAALALGGLAGTPGLAAGGVVWLPAGGPVQVTNTGATAGRFRFIGLGRPGEVAGAGYEMEPLPWAPGSGAAYDVTLDRSPFPANSATPWHYHTGPAFGVLDGGVWENRQVDGSTRRIPTPGYYIQPANRVHALAQVGSGGYALIIQCFPPGQSPAPVAPGRGAATPTTLAVATAIVGGSVLLPAGPLARQTAGPLPPTVPAAAPSSVAAPATPSPTAAGAPLPATPTPPLAANPPATAPAAPTPPVAPSETALPPSPPGAPVGPQPAPGFVLLVAAVVGGALVFGVAWLRRRR